MKKSSVCIAGGLAVGATALVFAGASVDRTVALPASCTVSATVDACNNNPGPFIELEGEMLLSGLNARLIFQNNEKGTHKHSEDVIVDVNLIPDDVIRFAKQPPEGGVGGNPWIYIQFYSDSWEPLSDRALLGRCVQGLSPVGFDFMNVADVAMDVAADCSNSPGPFIELEGEIVLEGINAVLTFQNKRGNAPHTREEAVEVEIVIVPVDDPIKFAKQPPLGGVGGNPRIYLQFTNTKGEPLSKKIYLGKCVQLSK